MKKPQTPSPEPSPLKKPLWETLVIAASFAGVWIYFLAWMAAGRAKAPLSAWWQFLLVPCLVALFIVFRRRVAQAQNTLKENETAGRPPF